MCRMQQIVPAASAAHVPSARVQAGQARKARKGLYKLSTSKYYLGGKHGTRAP
jgi:hypothetical protein